MQGFIRKAVEKWAVRKLIPARVRPQAGHGKPNRIAIGQTE